jgi:hypothetical protein
VALTFSDIPQFPRSAYEVDVPWSYIEKSLATMGEGPGGLELNPDFQRAHVWTEDQQRSYVEYQLMGGDVSRNIVFNSPDYTRGCQETVVLLDGKQRLEAVRKFMRNELTAFGQTCEEFGHFPTMNYRFRFMVCALETREEILNLYLKINAGGTPHSAEELDRVRAMLKEEQGQ